MKNKLKRLAALILALAMALSLLQVNAFAAESEETPSEEPVATDEIKVKSGETEENVEPTPADTAEENAPVEALSVVASGNCGANGNNLTWVLDSNGTLTISGSGAMADYKEGDEPWSSLTDYIRKIVIGDQVTSIGYEAFWDCYQLTSLIIGSSVKSIGESAFSGCEVKKVVIPDSVTKIANYAFSDCFSLSDLTIGTGVTSIGEEAFLSCENLMNIKIPKNVTSIGRCAFGYIYSDGPSGNLKDPNVIITGEKGSAAQAYAEKNGFTFRTMDGQVIPAAPSLSGISNESKGIKVTWKRIRGANGYRILRKAGSSKSWKTVATVNSTTTSYVDTKVSNGTAYRYTVRPYAKNNTETTWGKYNSKGLATVRLTTNKLSSAKNVKGRKMTVKWARNNKASGYQVQYATNNKFSSGRKTVKVSGNKNVSKTISKLSKNKKYYIRVRSYRTTGGKNYYSGWSNVRNLTIKK